MNFFCCFALKLFYFKFPLNFKLKFIRNPQD